jgi:hypothetical protein
MYSGLERSASLSDVNLATFKGDAVHTCSHQPQVILDRIEGAGDFPQRQANTSDAVLGQHCAKVVVCHLDIWQEGDRGGLVLRLEGSHHGFQGTLYLLKTVPILPESGLKELQLIMEALLSQRALTSCTEVARTPEFCAA